LPTQLVLCRAVMDIAFGEPNILDDSKDKEGGIVDDPFI
jgi:hypothetical protein